MPIRVSVRGIAVFTSILVLTLGVPGSAQLAHKGPAANIGLSKTLRPYDVVSIKPNVSGDDEGGINIDDHGVFTVKNMPLFWVIEFAYDVKQDQIAGLTGPVNDAHFDITAKILPSGSGSSGLHNDSDMQAMVILLLQSRFHLKAHLEPRIKPVYDLVVAKGGPKLKLSQDTITGNGWNISGEGTKTVLTAKDARMPDLADALSDPAGRKVIDKTGLDGHADITLKWSDDIAAQQGDADVISIFTAVEEQLGLKLVSSKGPVDTLVIDHVETPIPD